VIHAQKNGPGFAAPGLGMGLDTATEALPEESSSSKPAAIRAELIGDDRAAAFGYRVRSSTPILSLCRDLIDAGCFPWEPLEAYRVDVLCLKIRSIGEAARLRVNPKGTGFICPCAVPTAPPVRFGGSPYEQAAE
jgi:hypothetical protein